MTPLRRSFVVNLPDGTKQTEKLPSAKRVKIGGNYLHPVMFRGIIVVAHFIRVKGGWEFKPR